jgi:hypothetical protein
MENHIENNEPPASWTVKYWQWILSIPRKENPLNTGNINDGEFLCLPCTGGGEDCGRRLDVSGQDARKDILIPVFTSEYCTGEMINATDDQLRQKARLMATPVHMQVSVNDKPLIPYYIETEPFEVTVPSNHILDNIYAPAGRYRAISCGYWHKLKSLPSGRHLIKFGGTGLNNFHTKVVYDINIK